MTIRAGAIWWCRTVRESHKQLKWNHMRITLHNGSTRKVSISSVILSFLFRVSIVNRLDPDLSWAIIIVNFIICIVILAVLFCCRMSEEEGKKIAREKKKNGKIRYEPSPSMAINYIESLKELSRSRASSFFTMYTQQQQPSIPIHLTLSPDKLQAHSRKSNKRWKSIRRKIRWRKIPGTSIEILNFSMKYLNKFHKYLKDHS